MSISAKTQYATIAVLELAARYGSPEPVRVRSIAEAHGAPPRFLVQILLQLKGAGLVASTRGAAGGYQLIRDPSEITLADIRAIVEGPPQEPAGGAIDKSATARVASSAWREVAAAHRQAMESLTFAELVARLRRDSEAMYYI